MTVASSDFSRLEDLAKGEIGFDVALDWQYPIKHGVVTSWSSRGVWPARHVAASKSGDAFYIVSRDLGGFERLVRDVPLDLKDTETFCVLFNHCAPFHLRLLTDEAPAFVRRDIQCAWHAPRYVDDQLVAYFNDFVEAQCVRLTINAGFALECEVVGKGIEGSFA